MNNGGTNNFRNFNPLSPHGERPSATVWALSAKEISIHSPRMGRDSRHVLCQRLAVISIHSPRMGRDKLVNAARRD